MSNKLTSIAPKQQANPTCYVRVTNNNRNGFVEFDFSMGDPNLYVELILPPNAFAEFCKNNNTQMVTPAQAQEVDDDRVKWRDGAPAQRGITKPQSINAQD